MPTAQIVLRDLLKAHVAPLLRAHGYAGSGQDFHKRIGVNWAAINVQRNRYSSAATVEFTFNLGTASSVVRAEDGFSADDPAREIDCHWRARPAELQGRGAAPWSTVRSSTRPDEVRALGATLVEELAKIALPRLEAMASDEAILEAVLPGGEPTSGMVPAQMDVAGPILRELGPPSRLARYLAICDEEGGRSASLYTMFDDFPARMGPTRIAKRLADLSRAGFEPRQDAITDLGWANPSEAIKEALRRCLPDANKYIRSAVAQALGRLGDVTVAPNLRAMVRDDPARATAVHAAFALARLDERLDERGRFESRVAISDRHDRAVGHDRAALSELLRRLGEG